MMTVYRESKYRVPGRIPGETHEMPTDGSNSDQSGRRRACSVRSQALLEEDPVAVLENSHSITLLVYIYKHDGCTKSDLYERVSRNCRMPYKLNDLEAAGLIKQVLDGRSTRVFITDLGKEVASRLAEVMDLLKKD